MASVLPNLLVRDGKASAGRVRRCRSEVALKKHLDRCKVSARADIKQLQVATSGLSNINHWMGHQRPVRSSSTTALEKPVRRKHLVIAMSNLECGASDEEVCSSLQSTQDSSLPKLPSSPSHLKNLSQKSKYLEPLKDRPLLESATLSKGQNHKNLRTNTESDKNAMMLGGRPYKTFPFIGELQSPSKSKHRRNLSSLQMKPISPKKQPTQSEPTESAGFKQRRASRGSCEVALELNCPLETTLTAKSLFDQYAKKGILDFKSFGEIVEQIMRSTRQQLTEDDMSEKLEKSWREANRNKKGTLGFDEFAIWYSSWGFQQEMLLSPQKIRRGTLTRDFAKKHDIDFVDVDDVYTKFQHFDEDGSGLIEFPEFVKLLHKVLKVPEGAELPATRLSHFWKEIDIDGSGSVCADEFLQWFLRYFDVKGNSNVSPLEHFYQSMRPNFGRSK
eukprot:gnl/MRDRNA2_/MRDRNA2_104207_c0_seq1.p1 gnl/MRDRNA2_/MRDRNA2_104207_c0~~gnl/MRDRNA2_/MRDRNA2_104207_c0_seq1.p1  ORF type:complete len:446 (+),score=75.02 gnl/MRDRNA2_/MRDRNA2_104207_c0_seq1:88-1425(+)